jgi:heme exporter protein B
MNPAVSWHAQARALLSKDLRAELRTKVAVSAVAVFTFAALLLIGIANISLKDAQTLNTGLLTEPLRVSDVTGLLRPAWEPTSKMGLLWVLLCFAAFTGLAHTFVHEEDSGTTAALRLSMSASAVYAGKLAFNLILIFCVAVLVTPVYMGITGMPLGSPLVFISVMLGGCLGLAGAATIIGALAAKAQGTAALYAALGLPMLVVFLIMLLNAAATLYAKNPMLLQVLRDVGGLFSFGVLLIAVSALTFNYVWED